MLQNIVHLSTTALANPANMVVLVSTSLMGINVNVLTGLLESIVNRLKQLLFHHPLLKSTLNRPHLLLQVCLHYCEINLRSANRNSTCILGFDCSNKTDGDYPDPNNPCSQFWYICSNGVTFPQKCPADLVFDAQKDQCAWPSDVPSCQSTTIIVSTKPTTSPPSKNTFGNNETDFTYIYVQYLSTELDFTVLYKVPHSHRI